MIDLPAHGAVCGLCKESLSPLYQVRDRWLCLDCFHAFHDLMESYQDWDAVLKQARERKDARRAIVPEKRKCGIGMGESGECQNVIPCHTHGMFI